MVEVLPIVPLVVHVDDDLAHRVIGVVRQVAGSRNASIDLRLCGKDFDIVTVSVSKGCGIDVWRE